MTKIAKDNVKTPVTDYDVHPLITNRWSPRAFADKAIDDEQLLELFEAARWAPSAFNEQPWKYVYAHKGSQGFDQLWDCLTVGNQPWTRHASVLVVAMIHTNYQKNGIPNAWAQHDLGLANAQLFLQATYRNIYGHMMAGFDQSKLTELLSLDSTTQPICMMALGYLGDPEHLEEPYKAREMSRRTRKPVNEFVTLLS